MAQLKLTPITSDRERFFRHYELDYAEIARTVVALMAIPEPWVLSIDRTEWQFGDCAQQHFDAGDCA